MVRTAATGVRATGGKSSKAAAKSSSKSIASLVGDKNSNGSGNSVCSRETPTWQKPINCFFKKAEGKEKIPNKPVREENKDDAVASCSSVDVTNRDAENSTDNVENVTVSNNSNNDMDLQTEEVEVDSSNGNEGSMTPNEKSKGAEITEGLNKDETMSLIFDDKENKRTNEEIEPDTDRNCNNKRKLKTEVGGFKKLKPEFYKHLEEFEALDN